MKKLIFITCLTGCIFMASCSVEDGDAFADNPKTAYNGSMSSVFDGRWNFESFSPKAFVSENLTNAAETNTSVMFKPHMQGLTVQTMPAALFLALVGLDGWETSDLSPYDISLEEKGYSKNTTVYSLKLSDYMFSCKMNGQTHSLRISFQGESEMVIDNYLSTCSLLLGVKDVYVDNEVKSSEPGILTLFIALQ